MIDDQVDAGIMEINRTQASFILDSRMARVSKTGAVDQDEGTI